MENTIMTRHDADHWAMKCLDCNKIIRVYHRRELCDVKDRSHLCVKKPNIPTMKDLFG